MVQDLRKDNIELTILHPGFVDTDMTGHQGTVSPGDSASSMVKVLESGQEINGKFIGYDGVEIPW